MTLPSTIPTVVTDQITVPVKVKGIYYVLGVLETQLRSVASLQGKEGPLSTEERENLERWTNRSRNTINVLSLLLSRQTLSSMLKDSVGYPHTRKVFRVA